MCTRNAPPSKRVFGFNEYFKQLVTIRMHYRLQYLSADIDGAMVIGRAYTKIRPMYSL
jgi:hypothetical protein